MTTKYRIAVLVGSLRKDSLNRKMALAASSLAPPSLNLEIVEFGALPLYNSDLEEGTLTNPATRDFLAKYMPAFAYWVKRHVQPG